MTPEEIRIKHLNDAMQSIVDAGLIVDNYSSGALGEDPQGYLLPAAEGIAAASSGLALAIQILSGQAGIDPERPDLNPDES